MNQAVCTREELNRLTEIIIGAAIEVHRELGPGLLESAYEACLAYELAERGLRFDRQKEMPVAYKRLLVECGYRMDFLVEERIVIELKAVERMHPVYQAQLITYLRLSGHPVGLLINFNAPALKEGIKRLVHNLPD